MCDCRLSPTRGHVCGTPTATTTVTSDLPISLDERPQAYIYYYNKESAAANISVDRASAVIVFGRGRDPGIDHGHLSSVNAVDQFVFAACEED